MRALLFLLLSSIVLSAQPMVPILPEPVQWTLGEGYFQLQAQTSILVEADAAEAVGTYLAKQLRPATGYELPIERTDRSGAIELVLSASPEDPLGEEGYRLLVTSDGVQITANQPAGLFYGVQSLLQLLPPAIESSQVVEANWSIPAVEILDYPRFGWRGLHLDVSRHFFTTEAVKRYIDQMARFKYNRFHWHLTDDNGWRIEIKSRPKLTEVGAWRVPRYGTFNSHEPPQPGEAATDGGFYTQDEIREIVRYAQEQFIEILPEIDVPGHSMAAVAAYPELCVTEDTSIQVNPGSSFAEWHGNGTFSMTIDNTLDPSDEDTYEFLEDVFSEVAQLFPFDYIHMGGDEAYKGYWERDPDCQAFMKARAMESVEELQAYFVERTTEIITQQGKKTIGWDEIMEGGLADGAAVMSWRGTRGGIEATQLGAPVVMSPTPMCYLDLYQGDRAVEPFVYGGNRLTKSYHWDPIPEEAEASLILGGQGNVWTEQITVYPQIEYMLYPRALALIEIFWSPANKRNWERFIPKVEHQFQRFDRAEINYATSFYDPIIEVGRNEAGRLVITLTTEVDGLDLYYTLDNALPNPYFNRYEAPIVVPVGTDLFRVISYRDGKPIGKRIDIPFEDLEKRVPRSLDR